MSMNMKERHPFKTDATLDTVGMLCPIPIYLTSKKIKELKTGEVLEVLSDDEGILTDIPSWCKATGNEIINSTHSKGVYCFYIRKIS